MPLPAQETFGRHHSRGSRHADTYPSEAERPWPWGPCAAGIRSATSYPGSPSSEVIEALIGWRGTTTSASSGRATSGWRSRPHRSLDRRPSRPGLHQERRHERHARPAHGPEPDPGPWRTGHRPGRRPRRLRLAERPGHAAARDAPGNAHVRTLHAGRGVPDDGRGVRPLRAIPDPRHPPRDPELRPVFGDVRTPRGFLAPGPGNGPRALAVRPRTSATSCEAPRLHDRFGAFAAWGETSPYSSFRDRATSA